MFFGPVDRWLFVIVAALLILSFPLMAYREKVREDACDSRGGILNGSVCIVPGAGVKIYKD
jgi:hypothetical protein